MIFGAYCAAGGLLFTLCFLALLATQPSPHIKQRLARFSWLALTALAVGLVAFTALSLSSGLLQFGTPQSYNFPVDYMRLGPLGWLALAVAVVGVLSPLLAVFIQPRR